MGKKEGGLLNFSAANTLRQGRGGGGEGCSISHFRVAGDSSSLRNFITGMR